MEMTNTDSLKEQLMMSDPEFRELAREHGRYEERLSELSALTYPSDEEQLEEITLKKKKLALKDQMYSIMLQHQRGRTRGIKVRPFDPQIKIFPAPAARTKRGRAHRKRPVSYRADLRVTVPERVSLRSFI